MNEIFYTPPAKKARVEIIPLIDVVFFLLATFVLFTLSLNRIKMLDIPLPIGGEASLEDHSVFIQASDEGTFYWKQGSASPAELISAAELPGRLATYKANVPDPSVLVRGDRDAKFGAAVLVLDEAHKAGIERVSVETRITPSGR